MANAFERKSIAQLILQKSTDFFKRINRASWRAERCHSVVRVPSLSSVSALTTPSGWARRGTAAAARKEEEAVQLVVCCMWRPVRLGDPNGVLILQDRADRSEATVF